MPNPVAEVVERLDVLQEIDAAIEDAQAGQMEHDIIVTLQLAKAEIKRWRHVAKQGLAKCTPEHTWAEWVADRNAEIERLSRERDTGVPEGWRLVPMIGAEVRADHPITSLNPDPTFEVFAIRAEADQRLYVRGENTCWFNIDGIAPAAAPQPPTVSPDIVALTRERDQTREALAKELDAAKADLNSSFFCVFLDGRNEHGSHVVEMPGSNITPDDAKDLVAVLNDQDLGFAEQIIKDAESLGHEVGHCVVTIWDLTHDPEWGVECEYRRISPVLTNLMVGTPDEQRARSVLQSEKEDNS